MDSKILELIKKYHKIIILRHKNPDGDAIGSQYGLFLALKENFQDKEIYALGDLNDRCFKAHMDTVDDITFENALVIITDVAVQELVSDSRYNQAKEIVIIDHHQNDTNIENVTYYLKDPSYSSASLLVTRLLKNWNLMITKEAATYLYGGIVTDTGRFLYLNSESAQNTFELASYLMNFSPDIQAYYDYLYLESLKIKQAKMLFNNFLISEHGVAYKKNLYSLIKESGLDFFTVSRGMVNMMSGIKEVLIWANFTENESGLIIAELRSRGIMIVDIAKKYGGGGHNEACGATLKDFQEADLLLKDLDERMMENENFKTNI